jgi:hypothetical protein
MILAEINASWKLLWRKTITQVLLCRLEITTAAQFTKAAGDRGRTFGPSYQDTPTSWLRSKKTPEGIAVEMPGRKALWHFPYELVEGVSRWFNWRHLGGDFDRPHGFMIEEYKKITD